MNIDIEFINCIMNMFSTNDTIKDNIGKYYKQMIDNSNHYLTNIDKKDTTEAIITLTGIIRFASIIDINDVKSIDIKETERFINIVTAAINNLNFIYEGIYNNLQSLVKEAKGPDYESMSKEELIKLLRKKK